jgi:hypothetical protein
MDRNEILNKVLEYSKTKSIGGYEYAYAYGMLSVMLTDKQLKDLERVIKNG